MTNTENIKDFIANGYRNILKREPDLGGLEHYTNYILSGGITKDRFLEILRESEEYRMVVNKTEILRESEGFVGHNDLDIIDIEKFINKEFKIGLNNIENLYSTLKIDDNMKKLSDFVNIH